MGCCNVEATWTAIPQPGQGFVLTSGCESTTIKSGVVKMGEVIAQYQAVFMDAAGLLVADDADANTFWGFAVSAVDATAANTGAPFYVAGTFDGEQAVFATATWNDPVMTLAMRDRDIFLVARK